MLRLHSGVLKLNLETGRYQNIERSNHICEACNSDVETELHFLFECEKYEKIRTALYHKLPLLLIESSLANALRYCVIPLTPVETVEQLWTKRNSLLYSNLNKCEQP